MKEDIHYPVAHRSQAMIDSFKTRYDDFDTTLIADIVHDSIGLRPINVKQSNSWGSAHVIFYLKFKDYRDLVFRANINIEQPEVEMLIEKLVTELAQKQGVPTNTILHVDISRKKYDFDFTIQKRLDGIDPEDEFAGTADDYDTFNFETGQAIAKLGQIKLDGFGRFNEERAIKEGVLVGTKETVTDYIDVCLAEDIDALIEYKVITAKQAKDVLNFFEQRKNIMNIQQGSLVHYDLADHNLRYNNGHLEAIFDWETAVVASPVLDLASFPTWKSHYPKRAKLIEGFVSIQQLPDNFEEMEKIYLLRTMVWKIRYAIRTNILNQTHTKKFKDALTQVGIV